MSDIQRLLATYPDNCEAAYAEGCGEGHDGVLGRGNHDGVLWFGFVRDGSGGGSDEIFLLKDGQNIEKGVVEVKARRELIED